MKPRARQRSRNSKQSRLFPGAGLGHHAHRLPVPLKATLEGGLQGRHLGDAPDELREPARPRDVEPRAQRSQPLERVHAERLAHALEIELPEGSEREVALDEPRGVRRQIRRTGLGQLFHALRQADGVPLRGVVHAQIVADPPTTTSPELIPMRAAKLIAWVRRSSSA